MISETLYPTNKVDLVRALQRMNIREIKIHEPYHPNDAHELTELADDMAASSGNVTAILVRTP